MFLWPKVGWVGQFKIENSFVLTLFFYSSEEKHYLSLCCIFFNLCTLVLVLIKTNKTQNRVENTEKSWATLSVGVLAFVYLSFHI